MTEFSPSLLNSVALFTVVAIAPLFVVAATAFTKIAVVLLIVRNALGIQQTPPNILIYTLATLLTLFVMGPVFSQAYGELASGSLRITDPEEAMSAITRGMAPFKAFMLKYSDETSRTFFADAADKIWAGLHVPKANQDDLGILLPAFMSAELRRAFEIGFLLYLPFLVIDFAVSAVLIGLGMQMLSPPVISTPLKLLLFVVVDGWQKLLSGLVLSYTV